MDRRHFVKSLFIPLSAGLTDIANSYERTGLPKVPQSRFRILREPINPELLTIIKKGQPPAFDFTADCLTVEIDNDFTEGQQAIIKH